ncbi:uncharacterized protein LOC119555189 [Drosophila subpulchrella]|uniref:uncharacterized protein LOC119555189 n=1 Tax=Drosophila subpulchrella TaxID=1486046 RepID=UPI0018A17711|nr:uncharacterized protein LOC119555189 [Drosophila subpulchrella]
MIPISSAKLNSKLANRSLQSEGEYARGCISLLIGMVLGVCLAGIIFYPTLPNEVYRNNSQNILKIIKLEVPRNVSENATSNSKLGVVSVSPELSINSTHEASDEVNKSNDI